MRSILAFLLAVNLFAADNPIRGFPTGQLARRRELEMRLRTIPEAGRIRAYVQRMSAEPHHAGSPGSKAVAGYALGLLREWGLEARIEAFEALLPYPVKRELAMVEPVEYHARLEEPVIPEDADSADEGQLPTYNAYSGSGEVTAPLVYVNYGVPEDYEELKKQKIDVKGKIVIARYGKSWRGTKPKVAYENGAAGCLIYSDPKDDGYYEEETYPRGPMRPPKGVQRGSVMDMPVYVGDPLSPGWASEPGSRRLRIEEAKTLMKIPVLPISYEDAQPLLKQLGGPVAPESWRGALPITYRLGPGPAKVRLAVQLDSETRPLFNVIATIPGSEFPDEWVVYGNHHDAWVNGAQDPVSGAAALLETARALAELRKGGWQPKRTIVFALWDAEEFGLIGSTEWVEKHLGELQQKAAVYLNTDSTGRGWLNAGGSPSLEQFIQQVARDVTDPAAGKSLLDVAAERAAKEGATETGLRFGALGAGSDYVPFVHHAGIASLNLGMSGDDKSGIYHSIYDSFHWYTHFSDREFVYGKTLVEVMATSLVRLADAPVLPFEFHGLVRAASRYADEVEALAKQKKGVLDLRPLRAALARLRKSAERYEKELERAMKGSESFQAARLTPLNAALYGSERVLTLAEGLPRQEWYRNAMYGPGLYTGYGVKTLPGVRQAVEAGKWDVANDQAKAAARALDAVTRQVEKAAQGLKGI